MRHRMTSILVLASALAATFFVGPATGHAQGQPAASEAQTLWNIQNVATGLCLDATVSGGGGRLVGLSPCYWGDFGQKFERWNGGWTRHPNGCLTAITGPGPAFARILRLDPCNSNNLKQLWTSWHGGWYQNREGYCLEHTGSSSSVYWTGCVQTRSRQHWYVWGA
ncbi:ricin-type beta-trefoil lectin domain protein [Actinomadura fulvescens]|uniref:ricin-type beta-trefoil lectin domain protein n=1 Tax=Actinomadura fulvescens TaxID=46160 RepID=UPI003CD097BE